ncbi:MAG: T9SS type A sorting domain-containing protein [Saprospiraceae bacterium]
MTYSTGQWQPGGRPELAGISRVPDGMLDPRPNAGSPALGTQPIAPPAGYEQVSYIGAFSNSDNWAAGWTALSTYGYFGDLVTTGVGYVAQADGYSLKSYPNPNALGYVRLDVSMPNSESADLNIYDMNGRLVKNVFSGTLVSGAHSITAQVSDLNRGIYLIHFKSNSIDLTQKLILVH